MNVLEKMTVGTNVLLQPGQAHVVTEGVIAKIDASIQIEHHQSLLMNFVSFGTVKIVVWKKLKYRDVSSQWVTRLLTTHWATKVLGWNLPSHPNSGTHLNTHGNDF